MAKIYLFAFLLICVGGSFGIPADEPQDPSALNPILLVENAPKSDSGLVDNTPISNEDPAGKKIAVGAESDKDSAVASGEPESLDTAATGWGSRWGGYGGYGGYYPGYYGGGWGRRGWSNGWGSGWGGGWGGGYYRRGGYGGHHGGWYY